MQNQLNQYKIFQNIEDFQKFIQGHLGLKGGYYLALNPEKTLLANQDQELNQILIHADGLLVDGVGAKIALKKFLGKDMQRLTGIDAMELVLKYANENKNSVGVLGGKQEVIEKVKQRFLKQYPCIDFQFFLSGYNNNDQNALDRLGKDAPDLVFVGLGSPKQEKWIAKAILKSPQTLFTGVGGALDVWAGNVKRAPRWFQKNGLEWLYRFCKQPLKRFKRIFRLILFMVWVARERRKS